MGQLEDEFSAWSKQGEDGIVSDLDDIVITIQQCAYLP